MVARHSDAVHPGAPLRAPLRVNQVAVLLLAFVLCKPVTAHVRALPDNIVRASRSAPTPKDLTPAALHVAPRLRANSNCLRAGENTFEKRGPVRTCPCALYAAPPSDDIGGELEYRVVTKKAYDEWRRADTAVTPPSVANLRLRAGEKASAIRIEDPGDHVLLVGAQASAGTCVHPPFLFQQSSGGVCPLRLNEQSNNGLRVTPKIISGSRVADESSRRFIVGVNTVEKGACTGTVIGKYWVLTAAHCGPVANKTRLFVGGKTFAAGSENFAREVYIHPGYSAGIDENGNVIEAVSNDIALIRTWSGMGDEYVGVNANANTPVSGAIVRALGYGLSFKQADDIRGFLRQVDISVVSYSKCAADYRAISEDNSLPGLNPRQHLCAGPDKLCAGGVCRGEYLRPIFLSNPFP